MIRAVSFDYWRTLIFEGPGELQRCRVDRITDLLADHGSSVPRSTIESAHEFAFSRAAPRWKGNEQYTAEHAVDDMFSYLQLERADSLRAAAVTAFIEGGRQACLHVVDGLEPLLRELRARGLKVGIICDVGLTPSSVLRWHLEQKGLLAYFHHWSFSDEVGVYKPHLGMFEDAAAGLNVRLTELAHVGDQRRTDIAGARNAGVRAVRFRGVFDDKDPSIPDAEWVIDRIGDLLSCLL